MIRAATVSYVIKSNNDLGVLSALLFNGVYSSTPGGYSTIPHSSTLGGYSTIPHYSSIPQYSPIVIETKTQRVIFVNSIMLLVQ